MWRDPSGGFAAEDSRHRRRKGLPQATKQGGIAAEKAAKRQELLRQQHSIAERRKEIPPRAAKEFNLVCARLLFCALIRGLQYLGTPLKGFNCCGAKLRLRCAKSRFAKPRCSLQRERFSCFSLVRKEPKVPQRVATLWTPGERFKALPKKISAKFSGGTSRNRFFAQNRGEKALNRCEVRVLQRKDLERTAKEQPCSLVDSRLWLGGIGRWRAKKSCLGWK